jgi:hypothetical protein
MKNRIKIILGVFLLSTGTSFSQETISTTGGEATGSGGTASYTVGQISYTTNTGTNGIVAQGVQQTYTVVIDDSGVAENGISLTITTFPNPTLDKVNLKIEDFSTQELNYVLTDLSGRLLQEKKVVNAVSEIELNQYESGTYILKVKNTSNEVRTFKIIKH